jgi:myo-inositol-1(or 4)-monophosphatase
MALPCEVQHARRRLAPVRARLSGAGRGRSFSQPSAAFAVCLVARRRFRAARWPFTTLCQTHAVLPEALLELFAEAADAQAAAVSPLRGADRRRRTKRPGQFALDLVADRAVLEVLHRVDVAVVSEESGRTGPADAAITVVVDPVDGSTNCARDLPYWSISLCALDADGPLCALVANQATGTRVIAVRGGGAWRDGERLATSGERTLEDSVVALAGVPRRVLPWHQFRAMGSAALELCEVAAGGLDAFIDGGGRLAPWDYLGGLLACREAGAVMVDAQGRELVASDPGTRRQVIAAATAELLERVRPAVAP